MREPEGPGTLICPDYEKRGPFNDQGPRKPTSVTVKDQITVVNVHSYQRVRSPEFLGQICAILSRYDLVPDLFAFVKRSLVDKTCTNRVQTERVSRIISCSFKGESILALLLLLSGFFMNRKVILYTLETGSSHFSGLFVAD